MIPCFSLSNSLTLSYANLHGYEHQLTEVCIVPPPKLVAHASCKNN